MSGHARRAAGDDTIAALARIDACIAPTPCLVLDERLVIRQGRIVEGAPGPRGSAKR